MVDQTDVPSRSASAATCWQLLFVCWLIAMAATLGSLFFSEVMGLIPCELCWYQRIFIYPLAVILFLGLHPLDTGVVRYALPLAIIGTLFTLYHCLLFYGLIPENMQPCRQGVSCADEGMVLMGFLPIPLLSLAAFVMMIVLLLKVRLLAKQSV